MKKLLFKLFIFLGKKYFDYMSLIKYGDEVVGVVFSNVELAGVVEKPTPISDTIGIS